MTFPDAIPRSTLTSIHLNRGPNSTNFKVDLCKGDIPPSAVFTGQDHVRGVVLRSRIGHITQIMDAGRPGRGLTGDVIRDIVSRLASD